MADDALKDGGEIRETRLGEALSGRYLAYAMSTIMARSLPDVRDGLKPVHRRLLWAMHQLKLDPDAGFKKCARIVGDVMGKYHPHGDASIYDALVRQAQEFAARYTLVEGQGNFGNIDGDNAAAMRYTEARLTAVAQALLSGIDEDTVDFRATYDGEDREPAVLPAAFPNLLANGATGIAVGMATSIPPHNAGELCSAALALIANPQISHAELLTHVPGPDFPTGGVLVETAENIAEAYATGRGGFRLRAKWEVERAKGGAWSIVVTEIPYQVQKSKLIEQVALLLEEKKLPLLADIRDESTDQVRLVLEPRNRTVEPAVLMETLFRATQLESRFSLNMNVLDATRTPRVMSLREALRAWLDHRHEVLLRRTNHRLAAIARRLEVLDGYLIAYLNLDEVIRIIRTEDEPKPKLMARFDLTEVQAEAILNMRLRALRRLEEMEIKREHEKLTKEQKGLQALLASPAKQWAAIGKEIEETRKKFGDGALGSRRTAIGSGLPAVAVDESAFIEREPLTVVLSEKGWIRALKGHLAEDAELRFKEGDALGFRLHAQSTDRLVIFASNGKAYTLRADTLPRGRGDGQPLRLMIDLPNEDGVLAMFLPSEGARYLVAAGDGKGFLVEGAELLAEKRTGKQVLVLEGMTRGALCVPAEGDHVAVLGENRKLLVFPIEQLPVMTRGRGVQLQSYKDGGLADAKVFTRAEGLSWRLGERMRVETDLTTWRGNRAGAGKAPPNGFPRGNRFGS
ncbi:DNA topoisomerase IV subunit A [Roseococcus sp. SDR]|uniref:DNA topoisomerase IV subunit A n=1 Tax=Roseococcus sp. SDR TaxID=2835532 RepID=UPI001BCBB2A9|nr:DNA topoisomerase IV subunit A [Roseococcus sp. SDR]MBS7791939.1 DNA topoisomerase IV subunit A [Roseococcus sp. SDR]MBV1847253.1 DNA topoisomerase IV subunit A [Roseococcus sp. SDR]